MQLRTTPPRWGAPLIAILSGLATTCANDENGLPPPPATVSPIGPEGGVVRSDDGALTVTIPPGALATPTRVTAQPIATPAGAVAPAYELGPAGTTFSRPIVISLPEEPNGDALVLATFAGGTWTAVAPTVRDEATGRLSTQTTHLSIWARVRPERCDGPTACSACVIDCCRGADGHVSLETPAACVCSLPAMSAASARGVGLGACLSACIETGAYTPQPNRCTGPVGSSALDAGIDAHTGPSDAARDLAPIPICRSHPECAEGESCNLDGRCVPCDPGASQCTPGESCTGTADCLAVGCEAARCDCQPVGFACGGLWHPCRGEEVCDLIDNNCNGRVDEGCKVCASDAECLTPQSCRGGFCRSP
jgi:Putative metal-binding motif